MNDLKITNERIKGLSFERGRLEMQEFQKFSEAKEDPKYLAGVMKTLHNQSFFEEEFELFVREFGEENKHLIEKAFYHWIEYAFVDELLQQVTKGDLTEFLTGLQALDNDCYDGTKLTGVNRIPFGISQFAFLFILDTLNTEAILSEWNITNEELIKYFIPLKSAQ